MHVLQIKCSKNLVVLGLVNGILFSSSFLSVLSLAFTTITAFYPVKNEVIDL